MDRVKILCKAVSMMAKQNTTMLYSLNWSRKLCAYRQDNSALHEKLLAEAVLLLDPSLDIHHGDDNTTSGETPPNACY